MTTIGHRRSLIVLLLFSLSPWNHIAGQASVAAMSSSAYKHLLKSARDGDINDQTKLGIAFHYGIGIRSDLAQAEFWLQRAAGMGSPDAQLHLGVLYLQPEMVADHGPDALRWLMRAASSGLTSAEYNIGLMYLRGLGTTVNFVEAERWLRKADRHGVKRAKSTLGILLLGSTEPMKKTEGFEFVRKSAKDGDADGLNTLAYCYQLGIGTEPDLKAAVRLYLQAAKKGNLDAMHSLGVLYSSGNGVPRDPSEGFKWMKRGCDAGDAPSCWSLGEMYLRGEGVPKNLVLAYSYIGVADANREFLAKLAPLLSPEEKSRALTETEKWMVLHVMQLSALPLYMNHAPTQPSIETTAGN